MHPNGFCDWKVINRPLRSTRTTALLTVSPTGMSFNPVLCVDVPLTYRVPNFCDSNVSTRIPGFQYHNMPHVSRHKRKNCAQSVPGSALYKWNSPYDLIQCNRMLVNVDQGCQSSIALEFRSCRAIFEDKYGLWNFWKWSPTVTKPSPNITRYS